MLPAGEKPNEEALAEIREDVDKLESSTSTIKAQMASLNARSRPFWNNWESPRLNRQTGGGSREEEWLSSNRSGWVEALIDGLNERRPWVAPGRPACQRATRALRLSVYH